MVEIIIFLIVAYLFIAYVLPLILAVGGIFGVIAGGLAIVLGTVSAFMNYFKAIKAEMNFRDWEWENKDQEPCRRSYFFGPGYKQLINTVKTAFINNIALALVARDSTNELLEGGEGIFWLLKQVARIIFNVLFFVCILGVGTVLCVALAVIHGSVTTAIMVAYYLVFSVVWLIDWVYLLRYKINCDCPECKNRYRIPAFRCDNCGQIHRKLVPGPYGIWKHRCTCGAKMSSTFLNGRSKYEAVCPVCEASLVASDARPIVLQLVGGSSSGKTVYLTAFYHEFLEKLDKNPNIKYRIGDGYEFLFSKLEDWYRGDYCDPTSQLNSQMYPILIDGSLGVKRQFNVLDIGGEMFNGFTAASQEEQRQFRYCDGLLFVFDPFSDGFLRRKRMESGEDMSGFSNIAAEDVVTNLINYLISNNHIKNGHRSDIPVAVLITKADLKEIKSAIGAIKITSIFKKNPELYESYADARDGVCREFLLDNGFGSAVNNLELQFNNVHYFPVSAMGHPYNGKPYEPWGVMEPVDWILSLTDEDMHALINSATND